MGCHAITPHLVSLAKRLEGRPFHLLASHCQSNPKSEVVSYIKSKGVTAKTPNFTVTSQGRHPKVKGSGYVPYYIVFDHRGKIAHHHMCGDYHEGDGLKFIEWVDKLLDRARSIDLGKEKFEAAPKLAAQIASPKKLNATLKTIEKKLADERTSDELRSDLDRLLNAVESWRDRRLADIDNAMGQHPSRAQRELKSLEKELSRTTLGPAVTEKLVELKGSDDFKAALEIEKKLDKVQKHLDKMKPCKNCKRLGHDHKQAGCNVCARMNKKKLAAQKKKLEALLEKTAGLPIKARLEVMIAAIG
ncbi:MAG: hypothetical protein V3W41_04525 [Planctomycetota bacterium]